MNLEISDSSMPIFKQVAEQIKESILNTSFKEGEQIPSTTEISKAYKINPATVLKGMNILVDEQLIEKKRGLGMFVLAGAREKILNQKKNTFLNEDVRKLITEAQKLSITKEELIKLVGEEYK